MDNKRIAEIFQEIGDILEIKGENSFRVNAYKNASISILNSPFDLRDIFEKNPRDLEKIPGVGQNLREHIVELFTTGRCKEFEKIQKSIPKGLLSLLRIRGVGPKKVKLFYSQLKIHDVQGLKRAAESGLLAELPGMGEKSQKDILEAISEHAKFDFDRSLIGEALMEAEKYIEYMKKCEAIKRIEYAGSLRRREETIGDIDLLATVTPQSGDGVVADHFVKYHDVLKVVARGETKSAVILEGGMQVDLRVVEDEVFGAALHYFTGSKAHNIKVREMAKKKGLKVSEYGVFKLPKGNKIACKTEKDVFDAVGLPYIEPELRKGEDEIEFALKSKKMPRLVELEDLKGDLHIHSVWSDGTNSIAKIAEVYKNAGFEYIAMSDHSSAVGITGGMGTHKIKEQWKEIDHVNKNLREFKILKSCEVDILKDGSLDFSDDILKQLDVVVASAHMYMRLDEEQQTKRIIAAIENPYVKILGHPTGRMINQRGPMKLNMEKIIDACRVNKVAIEINSNPLRLDLSDRYARMVKEKGVKIVINSDGHDASQYQLLKYGIFVARRAWLTKDDVLNTKNLKQFLSFWE
jgi:DNA polymerase (family 10)